MLCPPIPLFIFQFIIRNLPGHCGITPRVAFGFYFVQGYFGHETVQQPTAVRGTSEANKTLWSTVGNTI